LDGKQCRHYPYKGHKSEDHTLVEFERRDGTAMQVVLEKTHEEMMEARTGNWEFVIEGDYTVPAIASLIKAAHLTLFQLLGYRYVYSAAGQFVGYRVLGDFFRRWQRRPMSKARHAAQDYFAPFRNMVRVLFTAGDPLLGTVDDRKVFSCIGSSGTPFAVGVIIRAGEDRHVVLVPSSEHPDRVATYLDFLSNSNDRLMMTLARYDSARDGWEIDSRGPKVTMWPKDLG
jgi:hypothetical protein